MPALIRELEETKEALSRYEQAVEDGSLVSREGIQASEAKPSPIIIGLLAAFAIALAFLGKAMLAG